MGLISKSANGWELHTIADGSLSCDNFQLDSNDIDEVERLLTAKFGKRMKEDKVFVSYDNWSGVFIMHIPGTKSPGSDELIRKIYGFLSRQTPGEE